MNLFDMKPEVRWTLVDLDLVSREQRLQAAQLLVSEFKELWPGEWIDLESALLEVNRARGEQWFARVAIDQHQSAVGLIIAEEKHRGNVWEIRPLVVHSLVQQCGIGRSLLDDLETHARRRGVYSLLIGAPDLDGAAIESEIEALTDITTSLVKSRAQVDHPLRFFLNCGFSVAGILPDACGKGKPLLWLTKSLRAKPQPPVE